jgi:hypothetical protein
MDKHTRFSIAPKWVFVALNGLLFACGGHDGVKTSASQNALTAQCIDQQTVPADAWRCPDARSFECGEAENSTIYVPQSVANCSGDLSVSDPGPYSVGTHTITVKDGSGATLCSSDLTVTDSKAPELTTHVVNLWPPNHKFHEVSVSDCVSAVDACDGDIEGEFIWASSDEPIDDIGDGHFGPDIGLGRDAQHACVRSERQGPKDGRVYKLGVRVKDSAGHEVEGECLVIVDHDQRGTVGKDSGEAYRIQFDPTKPGPDCGDGSGGSGGKGGGGAGSGSGGHGDGSGGTGGGDNGGSGGSGDTGGMGDTGGTGGSGDNGGTGGSVTPF